MVRYYIFDTVDEGFNFARYFRFNHSDGYYCSRTSSELPETTGQLPELTNDCIFAWKPYHEQYRLKAISVDDEDVIQRLQWHYITKPMINTDWSTEHTNFVSQYMQDYNWHIPQYTLVHTSQSHHLQNYAYSWDLTKSVRVKHGLRQAFMKNSSDKIFVSMS